MNFGIGWSTQSGLGVKPPLTIFLVSLGSRQSTPSISQFAGVPGSWGLLMVLVVQSHLEFSRHHPSVSHRDWGLNRSVAPSLIPKIRPPLGSKYWTACIMMNFFSKFFIYLCYLGPRMWTSERTIWAHLTRKENGVRNHIPVYRARGVLWYFFCAFCIDVIYIILLPFVGGGGVSTVHRILWAVLIGLALSACVCMSVCMLVTNSAPISTHRY